MSLQPVQEAKLANFAACLWQMPSAITQLAIQALFISSSLYVAAALFPLSFQAVLIPSAAIAASLASLFLFPEGKIQFFPCIQASLPPNAPVGLENIHNNCAVNSVIQFLEADPAVAEWLRHFPNEETDLEALRRFIAPYHQQELWENFLHHYQTLPPQGRPSPVRAFREFVPDLNPLSRLFLFGSAHRELLEQMDRRPGFVRGSQKVKEAVHALNGEISRSCEVQVDAHEVLLAILDLLPDHQKMHIELRWIKPRGGSVSGEFHRLAAL